MRYVTPERMKELESLAFSHGLTVAELMENAGRAVAEAVNGRYGIASERRVLVVCGTGNNGGDGLVAARYLSSLGWKVRALLLTEYEKVKTAEARENLKRLPKAVEVATATEADSLRLRLPWFRTADVIVDAILGTGVRGEIREPILGAINLINHSDASIVAVDIPSGLDPATGEVRGTAVRADLTVALHAAKAGTRGNERYTGEVVVVPIGIEEDGPS